MVIDYHGKYDMFSSNKVIVLNDKTSLNLFKLIHPFIEVPKVVYKTLYTRKMNLPLYISIFIQFKHSFKCSLIFQIFGTLYLLHIWKVSLKVLSTQGIKKFNCNSRKRSSTLQVLIWKFKPTINILKKNLQSVSLYLFIRVWWKV